MNQPLLAFRNLAPADKIKAIVVTMLLGLLLVLFGFLVGLLVREHEVQLSDPAQPGRVSVERPAIPLSGKCVAGTLVLGAMTFEVRVLRRNVDGSLAVPEDTSGIAYEVEGTANPVFLLSPTPQNITVLQTISIGSAAILTGSNCERSTYILAAPRSGSLDSSIFENTSARSIAIFFPTVSSGEGFLYQGQLAEP